MKTRRKNITVEFCSLPETCSRVDVLAIRAAQAADAIMRTLYEQNSPSGSITLRSGGGSMKVSIRLVMHGAKSRRRVSAHP